MRFKEAIPPEFIVGVEKKQDKYVNNKLGDLEDMRKLQEFREPTPPESPSGKPRGVKPDGYPGTQFMYSMGFEKKPGTGILCHPNLPGEIKVSKNEEGEPIYIVNGKRHSDDFEAIKTAAGPHLEKLALGSVFKTEHFMGFKEFVENLAEEVSTSSIPANNTDGVANFDPLLGDKSAYILNIFRRFLDNAKLKPKMIDVVPSSDLNRYGHPFSAAQSAVRAGDGSVQGT